MPPIQRLKPYPAVANTGRPVGESSHRDWELAIHGDLTDKESDLVARMLEVPRRSRGIIFFDSCGGSAYVGLALASLIRLRGLKVDAVVAGECSSAAIMPFAACQRRFVTKHSTLLFHPIRWQSEENVRLEEASEWARHFQQLEGELDDLLAKMFGCSLELLTGWTRPGRFVSGQELADAGLAHLIDLFAGDVWQQIASVPDRLS
jgi:ATP-dependent protease ClpP protease subunit